MANPTITIHDAATGETVEREMTDDECATLGVDGSIFQPEEETPEE